MPTTILPESFILLLLAFRESFTIPSFGNFECLVAGWVHCPSRHTITNVALASGAVGQRHLSVFHRFFARALWSLDGVGQVLFCLALRWIPAGQPLVLLGDDTLAHKSGKCVSLAAMHHDPLLSTAQRPFCSFGHVWVAPPLWVPLPVGPQQGFALPVRVRLFTSSKRGGQTDAPSRPTAGRRQQTAALAYEQRDRRTKRELRREMTGKVAQWAPERTIHLAVDSAYAGRTTLEHRPAQIQVISRLRPDAALWALPPARRPGQKGRPRRRGERLPTPQALAAACQDWQRLPVTLYGHPVVTQVWSTTALWYAALPSQPVQVLMVRDPRGRRQLDVFFCTDLSLSATAILETHAHRWTLEVAFHGAKQFLGFENPQSQTRQAVQRTAPLAFVVYDLVLLWAAAGRQQPGSTLAWVDRPWYRRKHALSFPDMLTALRRAGWRQALSTAPLAPRRLQNSLTAWPDAVLATA